MTSKEVLNIIEFDKVLNLASNYAISNIAKERILDTVPTDDFEQANCELDLTFEAFKILYEKTIDPIDYFDDIAPLINKARINAMLSCGELLKIGRLIKSAHNAISKLKPFTEFDKLQNIVVGMVPLKKLLDNIQLCILDENEVNDQASEKLASIRRKIANCKANIKEKLNAYIKSPSYSKYLQDSIITVRNERFVIPVKMEYKSEIKGLLHDQSSSKATAFIEPIQVVELNNQLKSLLIDEQLEIERILTELTLEVNNNSDALTQNLNSLISLDIIFAKARYAEHVKAVKPNLIKDNYINIKKGRHPLIPADKVVPIDIELGREHKVLIISGPNTGGKTVSLKTVGLFSVMAASGFMIPAQEVYVPIFNRVFCDIGDFQSIENSLSTYSSHIKNLVDITDNLTQGSLILIDEIGAGTDPTEGAALAIGVIKYILKYDVLAVITTHYSELKEFSLTHPNIRNASMEFDYKTLLPTYKILMDLPGTSNALAIAGHLGLKQDILKEAKLAINQEKHNFENVLRLARALKTQAEKEYEQAQLEREQLQKKIQEVIKEKEELAKIKDKIQSKADQEVKEIIRRKTEQANEYLEQISQILKQAELDSSTLLKAKQFRTAIEKQLYETEAEQNQDILELPAEKIKVGMNAYLINLNKECIVLSLPDKKNEVEVSVGNMKLNVKVKDLGILKDTALRQQEKKEPKIKPKIQNVEAMPVSQALYEINILGNTVDEAEAKLDLFIDNALRSNMTEIKIVHGKGTGALRRGVHDYLKTHRAICGFRLGLPNEGGSGVTIVTLKSM
ncbi:MAG TPA: endonuclease MutS2 [Clostridia bacterium]|jgi:DNA mismatch repair protein MutS2